MKFIYINFVFFIFVVKSFAQYDSVAIDKILYESLKKEPNAGHFLKIGDSLSKISKNIHKCYIQHVIRKSKSSGNKHLEALSLNNLGLWYLNLSLYSEAYNFFNLSYKKFEEINNDKGIFVAILNLGNLYFYLGNFEKALSYQFKALKLVKSKMNSPEHYSKVTNIYLNLGSIYGAMDKLELSRNYFFRALDYYKLEPDKDSITRAYIYNNISNTYSSEYDQINAEKYGKIANEIKIKYGNNGEKADAYSKYSQLLLDRNLLKDSKSMALKALELSDCNTPNMDLLNCYQRLAKVNMCLKDYKEESHYLKLSAKIKLYLDSAGKEDEVGNAEIRKELSKKSLNDSLQNLAQLKVRDLQLVQKKRESYYGIIALIVVGAFAFLFYRRFKFTQKQKEEIEFQKKTVDLKNKEITESITYAKNVQDALMPHASEISKIFNDGFINYFPKDIVAGDFYWWHDFSDTSKKKVLIAVADCTGHGVPGAMVSVVCINALNRAVNEFNLEMPNEILDKVNFIVNETFSKNNKHINDGMDISLLLVDYDNMIVNWSGANNRLVYFDLGKLTEVKPDKQAIGKSDVKKPFSINSLPLKNDTIYYLITDGFHDQFGGDKNKKLGMAKLKTLLLENYKKPMAEQGRVYEAAFINWKSNLEQTDDVTLIGIKI